MLKKKHILPAINSIFWFVLGGILGLFFFVSFVFIYYKHQYQNVVYPGVTIDGKDLSGMSQQKIEDFYTQKNERIQEAQFTLTTPDMIATLSAKDLNIGYNAPLLAQQAYSVGRSNDLLADPSLILQAYLYTINLPSSFTLSEDKLESALQPIQEKIHKDPVDARFTVQNGRVTQFNTSSDGQDIDIDSLKKTLNDTAKLLIASGKPQNYVIAIPIKIIKPTVTTQQANNLGIVELIASGTSLFHGSIENRIYNVTLAASRLNGILIEPNEVFSFAKAIGDISSFTGYKQAYVIQNGHTVLGDGGGVCQVSTTLFRAALNAGLPIVERNPHAYRVHYYEEDSAPGIDAAVYVPSVDLKFKNDTGHSLLIQTSVDQNEQRLTFYLYGTKDSRVVSMTEPVITSQTPAPEPLYQDDPTLAKGQIRQVDFAAAGASVYFTRTVKKDGKVLIYDKFVSNYRPWQAVYLRGTKE